MTRRWDIAVIGGGFAGSLAALLLERLGFDVVLLERQRHPRFAIGESSSPVANLVLEQLARRHDLPQVAALSRYGTWRARHPQLACGLKRGFSYFQHTAGAAFAADADHTHELLVGASPADEVADTHWYRADFDHFLLQQAATAGVEVLEQAAVRGVARADEHTWELQVEHRGESSTLTAAFVIDGSGAHSPVVAALDIADASTTLHTHSQALYAHFTDVAPWGPLLREAGGRTQDHPFECDAAALHHVFAGGWMWVLRFNNGRTSAGFVLQDGRLAPGSTALEAWRSCLQRYPSIARQFAAARLAPETPEPRRTPRLQRLVARTAGPGWALLPSAAGFIDPFFSTGNAQALCAVARLIDLLPRYWNSAELADGLAAYDEVMRCEFHFIDRLVHGCSAAFGHFAWMAAFSMFYFAAATCDEHRRRAGRHAPMDAYLLADDAQLSTTVSRYHQRLCAGLTAEDPAVADAGLVDELHRNLKPYNIAGLCDPGKHNMYPFA